MPDPTEPLPPDVRRWCMAAAGACLLPLLTQLQPGLAIGIAGIAALSMLSAQRWGTAARLALMAVMGAVVLVTHDFHLGRDTGTAGLAALLAIKPFETHRLRDAHSLLGFSLFAPFAAFLQDQGPLVLLLSIPAVLLLMLALAALAENRSDAPPGVAATHGSGPARMRLRGVGFALLLALPLTFAGFWLFPRLPSPLWGTPENVLGRGGLGDDMRPDQWVDLFADDTPALRVRFLGAEPRRQDIYWRARVLWDFDGQGWSQGGLELPRDLPTVEAGDQIFSYEVMLEPTERRYLVTLDLPLEAPAESALRADMTVQTETPVSTLRKYALRSAPSALHQPELPPALEHLALGVPVDRNPRTRDLARQWRAEAGDDDLALVRRGLAWIGEDFSYSLTVPPAGRHPVDEFLFDSKVGFCQHFSSAFATLMREAGVPSRVVMGYLPGYRNPYGGYWVVRRMDAHAWVEVWLRGRGWTRVDPTSAVAPERVLDTVADRAREGALLPETFAPVLDVGDWLRRGWNDLVVGFNAERQGRLLAPFGVRKATATQLGMAFAGGAGVALALTLWLQMRGRPPRRDPVIRAWLAFTRRLRRAGLAKEVSEPPASYGDRLACALPEQGDQVRALSARYVQWRYGGRAFSQDEKAALVDGLRRFRPERSSRTRRR